jgi:mono/diheme cytochrome c family protein
VSPANGRRASGRIILALGAALMALALVRVVMLRPALTSAEKGRRLAERSGCFSCHGPEAVKGSPNLGGDGPVPGFLPGVLALDTPRGAPQVRDWIALGSAGIEEREAQEALADSLSRVARGLPPAVKEPEEHPILRMPAYGSRFKSEELGQLVDFVMAQALWGADRAPLAVRSGLEVAGKAGCFGCHGPLGLYSRPNPRSLKGYIPAWRGRDARELVRDGAEFRQWVREGRPERFARNPLAGWLLASQAVEMPAYRDRLSEAEVAQLDSLFEWVREGHGGH